MTTNRGRAARRLARLLATGLTLTGGLTAAVPAVASAAAGTAPCVSMTGTQPASPDVSGFNDVVVRSPCDAWAVGSTSAGAGNLVRTLIEHWDGTSWTIS